MMEPAWSQSVLQALATSIRGHAGLSFVPERYDELERRTRRAMAKAGITDVGVYTDGLGSGRISFDDWVAELTVGETYFFREPLHFEFLRTRALPALLALRGASHVFRVWSAGCASGEEAYSLAILFEEQFLSATLHLVATDVSRAALTKARLARYGLWSLRGSSEDWIGRYFQRGQGKQFVLIERIRQQVTFQYLNLALDGYPSFINGVWGNDVILCRNVLIYLDRDTVRAVARRLFDALAEGGWLITGPSDPPLSDYAPFETVVTDAGVFYRRSHGQAAIAGAALVAFDDGPGTRSSPAEDETTGVRSLPVAERSAGLGSAESDRQWIRSRRDSVPATTREGAADPLALAQAAFAAGRYAHAVELLQTLADHPGAAALEVRATANLLGAREASRLCTVALLRFPLEAELYVLQASLLLDSRDYPAATQAARRLLYLDRSLVVAHLLLGSILGKSGGHDEAVRAFRNARDLAELALPNDVVPFADGEKAARLADFARAQMQLLGAEPNEERQGAP
jgi:chemotaxis protein methyltransferase CheR